MNLNPGQVRHKLTDVQEQVPFFSTGIQQASKEKSVPQSSHTVAAGTAKIEAEQTLLANQQWLVTPTMQFTVSTKTGFPSRQSHSQQYYPALMANP